MERLPGRRGQGGRKKEDEGKSREGFHRLCLELKSPCCRKQISARRAGMGSLLDSRVQVLGS